MNSELCVSLMSVNRDLLGVLILESSKTEAFNEDDEEQMHGIARQVNLVMERAELSDQLVDQTSLAMATGGFVDFVHVAGTELQKIRRCAGCLSERESSLPEQGCRWAREIDESAVMLRQALDEAQNVGDMTLGYLSCDALVRKLVEKACEQRPTSDLTLEWDSRCGDTLMEVDRKAIRWALDYLVGSAVEAMKDKEGHLTVHTRLRAGQWAEVQIEDSGPDTAPELRPILFQPVTPGGKGMVRACSASDNTSSPCAGQYVWWRASRAVGRSSPSHCALRPAVRA